MPVIDWILIADRTRAKLFHVLPDGLGPSPVLACFTHEQGRLLPQERNTDKPGRVDHPAGWTSSVEPNEDTEHVESRRFAAVLVGHFELARQEKRFDRLTVVAPPKFLGVLRGAWTASLRTLIRAETPLDLMRLSDKELQERIKILMALPIKSAEGQCAADDCPADVSSPYGEHGTDQSGAVGHDLQAAAAFLV